MRNPSSKPLKDCPFGTLTVGDPVEYSEEMIASTLEYRKKRAKP